MRLWLKDSERRPDPEPVKTDDRTPILIGTGCWVLAFAALLVFAQPILAADGAWMLITCTVGIGLGLAGLVYVHRTRR